MIVFEQGTLDSLHAAKQAIDRAIVEYEACRDVGTLSVDSGTLFATLDNIATARNELKSAVAIAIK